MKKIQVVENGTRSKYFGNTDRSIVALMADLPEDDEKGLREYMMDFSKRSSHDLKIRYTDEESFIKDLIDAGIAEEF